MNARCDERSPPTHPLFPFDAALSSCLFSSLAFVFFAFFLFTYSGRPIAIKFLRTSFILEQKAFPVAELAPTEPMVFCCGLLLAKPPPSKKNDTVAQRKSTFCFAR